MGIEQQVYMKSDRWGRFLILTFCVSPLVVPLVAIGLKFSLADTALVWPSWPSWPAVLSSSAQASAPRPDLTSLGDLPSREAFHSVVFAGPSEWSQRFEASAGETRMGRSEHMALPVRRAGAPSEGAAVGDDLSRGGLPLRRLD